jgi:nicotinamidase-related amidase
MDVSLTDNYRAGGFAGSVGRGKKAALLMVDYAQAYFERSSPLYARSDETLEHGRRLLHVARGAGTLVIHTRVEYDAAGLNGGVFFRKVPALSCFCVGSPLAAFATGMEPDPGEIVVTKQYASAFFATSLASTLCALGVDTLVIGGMSTSGCVRATAVDAMQHGFMPIVARDACGDRHQTPHEANLFDLNAKYADVVGIDEARSILESLP